MADAPAESKFRLPLLVAVVLGLLALLVLGYRQIGFSALDNQLPAGDSAWKISIGVQGNITEKGQEVFISPVINTRFARLYAQSLSHAGMMQRRVKRNPDSRDIVLTALKTGPVEITVQFELHLRTLAINGGNTPRDFDRTLWLQPGEGIFVDTNLARSILDNDAMDGMEAVDKVFSIYEAISERIRPDPRGSNDAMETWYKSAGSPLGVSRLMVSLLRSEHVPARVVTGLDLSAGPAVGPTHWLEAYYAGQWHVLDTLRGFLDVLPRELVPFSRGTEAIVRTSGDHTVQSRYKIEQGLVPNAMRGSDDRSVLEFVDLLRISPQGRESLALLILLPLGVLVSELLRQCIGIRTFGTFTPTLLGLALVFADIRTALTIFFLVILVGFGGRSLLNKIKVTRGARLGLVFSMVALVMVFAVSLLLHFDPSVDTSVVLLPVVVLTTLIDRFYGVADASGISVALKRLMWTVFAAAFSLAVLLRQDWGHWLLRYPEMHLFTMALILLLSQYKNRKLSQVRGFEWIAEPPATSDKSPKNED